MIHENEIAIKVLTNEFADYPRNAWHYDREYLMICEALRLSKLHQPTVSESVCLLTDEQQRVQKCKYKNENKCLWERDCAHKQTVR